MRKIILILFISLFFGGCALYNPTMKRENIKPGTKLAEIFKCQDVTCLEAKGCKHTGKDKKGKNCIYKDFELKRTKKSKISQGTLKNSLNIACAAVSWLGGTYTPPGPMYGTSKDKYYFLYIKTGINGEKIKSMKVYKKPKISAIATKQENGE